MQNCYRCERETDKNLCPGCSAWYRGVEAQARQRAEDLTATVSELVKIQQEGNREILGLSDRSQKLELRAWINAVNVKYERLLSVEREANRKSHENDLIGDTYHEHMRPSRNRLKQLEQDYADDNRDDNE